MIGPNYFFPLNLNNHLNPIDYEKIISLEWINHISGRLHIV